jgi:hypothetical protein
MPIRQFEVEFEPLLKEWKQIEMERARTSEENQSRED